MPCVTYSFSVAWTWMPTTSTNRSRLGVRGFRDLEHPRRFGALTYLFFFSSRRRHTRFDCDWSSDVCSSDLAHRSCRPTRCRHRLQEPWSSQPRLRSERLRYRERCPYGPWGRCRTRLRCRSEEHTSELQSQSNLVCRLLLEKKKRQTQTLIRR